MGHYYWLIWEILILSGFAAMLTNCQTESKNIAEQNPPPAADTVSVSIASPMGGQSFSQDQTISFSGSAVLGSSGQIEQKNLIWTSDGDSLIGIGNSFTRSGLSLGNHIITLTATASSGEMGSATTQFDNMPSANGMMVLIESPAGSSIKPYELVELRGSATSPDSSPITNPLAFEWRSNLEVDPGPILGDSPLIETAGLTWGLHTITLNVSTPDSSGGTVAGTASIEIFVEFDDSGITFDILKPLNGSQLVQGQDLICTGSGSISGGGTFTEIIWISSINGVIGIGETCVVPYLSLGTHRLTVIATASDGRKGTASTIIEVIQ